MASLVRNDLIPKKVKLISIVFEIATGVYIFERMLPIDIAIIALKMKRVDALIKAIKC